MGAYMQPQGHVQVLMNTIDFLLNPQAALDAPRWQWIDGREVWLEDRFAPEIVEELRKLGHEVRVMSDYTSFGRGEIIWRCADGVLAGPWLPGKFLCINMIFSTVGSTHVIMIKLRFQEWANA